MQDPPGRRCKDRLQDEAQDNAGTRKGHLQDGEREPLMMNGGSRMHKFMDEHGQETSGKVFMDEQGAPM